MWNRLTSRKRRPLLWVVSGPSGSGKTTLCQKLLLKKNINIVRSISFTTRPKRKGEKNYRDYVFISKNEFLRMAKKGEFIECKKVFGNLYGTSKKLICSALVRKKDVLLCIDVKGALDIKRIFHKQAVFIFVVPPNEKILFQRIKMRAREDNDEIERRVFFAKTELSFAKEYDYLIVNDNLAQSIKALESIIIAKRLENELYPSRKTYR